MKTLQKISLLTVLACAGTHALAMDVLTEDKKGESRSYEVLNRNKVDGVEITPKNLYDKAPSLPKELESALESWHKDNQDVWKACVEQPGSVTEYKKKVLSIAQVMQNKKLSSLAPHNIIFAFPNASQYLLKISGPINRLCLQVANQDQPYGRVDLIDPKKTVPTYQTSSRVFGSMKLQDAKKHHKLDEIGVVKKYVWSPTKSCDDESCVVVEQSLKDSTLLKQYSHRELDELLTEKRIGQLLLAVKSAGLWNLTSDNIALTKETKKLVVVDTEQPNTMKPSQQFNQDESRYLFNVNSGVQSLYQSLPQGYKPREHVEKWARDDKDVMGANNAKDLIKLFDANKKK